MSDCVSLAEVRSWRQILCSNEPTASAEQTPLDMALPLPVLGGRMDSLVEVMLDGVVYGCF